MPALENIFTPVGPKCIDSLMCCLDPPSGDKSSLPHLLGMLPTDNPFQRHISSYAVVCLQGPTEGKAPVLSPQHKTLHLHCSPRATIGSSSANSAGFFSLFLFFFPMDVDPQSTPLQTFFRLNV